MKLFKKDKDNYYYVRKQALSELKKTIEKYAKHVDSSIRKVLIEGTHEQTSK